MTHFVKLQTRDQAALVLITLLEEVATHKRTHASVDHAVKELFTFLAEEFDVPEAEVALVAKEVASGGIRMLPGYVETEEPHYAI